MRFNQIQGRLNAAVVFACLLAFACRTVPVLAANAPSKIVIAHAGMNARTVALWTAQEQKFFAWIADGVGSLSGRAPDPLSQPNLAQGSVA